jgi:predicted nucleotidyltransferase component of viral defense system
MPDNLYWNTVTPLLKRILQQLMNCPQFDSFRLVGGTSLSLQLGHRMSDDIDLFTDAPYGSIDMEAIDNYLRSAFSYVTKPRPGPVGMGRVYAVGNTQQDTVKLDLFYTDRFIQPPLITGNIRLATIEEILAMKLDIVQRGARKKDFWDIHELLDRYTPQQMIKLHKERYPYTHDGTSIKANFISFTRADDDFDPKCLRGKYWEVIKLEIIETVGL